MISLAGLAGLVQEFGDAEQHSVGPLLIGAQSLDVDARPAVMGTVNLSRDSTYRESIATSTASAIRKARVQAAQGAHLVDIGAESSTARAARVGAEDQVRAWFVRTFAEGVAPDGEPIAPGSVADKRSA